MSAAILTKLQEAAQDRAIIAEGLQMLLAKADPYNSGEIVRKLSSVALKAAEPPANQPPRVQCASINPEQKDRCTLSAGHDGDHYSRAFGVAWAPEQTGGGQGA